MWRENIVPKLLGVGRSAYPRNGQWAVVDAQSQRSVSGNDECPMVNVHPDVLASKESHVSIAMAKCVGLS